MHPLARGSFLVFTLVTLALLFGCARRELPVETAAREGMLLVGNVAEPASLDPHIPNGTEWGITGTLFEPLVRADSKTFEPVPAAAESWTVSEDEKVFRFKLRANAKWSDGSAVTVEDWLFSLQRILEPKLGSAFAEDNLLLVEGAKDFRYNGSGDFSKVGIKALDERTLEFRLEQPTPFFLSQLTIVYPVQRKAVSASGEAWDRSNPWATVGRLVGNGPFVLTEWTPSKRVVVKKNPFYWNADGVELNGITFFSTDNVVAEENAFRAGQLHFTGRVPPAKLDQYKRYPEGPLSVVDHFGTFYYTVNTTKPPFSDPRVRLALSLAIDRAKLATVILKGVGNAAESFSPPGVGGYIPPKVLRFDPERARALLADAGFPSGAKFPPVEILSDAGGPNQATAELVQEMWRTNLGISATIRVADGRALNDARRIGDFDVAQSHWIAAYQDPFFFLSSWTTGNLWNEAKWSSPEFDQLYPQTWTSDKIRRQELHSAAERILLESAPVIPLYQTRSTNLVSPLTEGLAGQVTPLPTFAFARFKATKLTSK